MGIKEFLRLDYRKTLMFLLPIIFVAAITFFQLMQEKRFDLIFMIKESIFKFPCLIETNFLCKGGTCCFESLETQAVSSAIFYSTLFIYSWGVVWINDRFRLKGLLWRKMHKIEYEPQIKKVEEIKPIEIHEYDKMIKRVIEREHFLIGQEGHIKEELEKIHEFRDQVNKKKLKEIGVDLDQGSIRCSKCYNWKKMTKKDLSDLIAKNDIDILWKYQCKECSDKPTESKTYFDKVSGEWDKIRSGLFSNDVRDKAYSVAKIEKDKLAADIGCGTGFITRGLVKKGLRVIAVDQSEKMLHQLKKKTKNKKMIDCRVGESNKLPINDNEVDYVFANMYLHHVEDPLVAIKEMVRILKPGGKIVITDLDKHDFDFLKTEQHDIWMGFDRKDIKNWFNEAGLKNAEIDCVESNCCAKSNECQDNASISIFFAYGEKQS